MNPVFATIKNHLPARSLVTVSLAAAGVTGAVTSAVAFAPTSPAGATSATGALASRSAPPTWAATSGEPGRRSRGGWAGAGPAAWPPGWGSHIEYFHVVSTASSGPGAIIVTGAVNAGGAEKPGRAIDGATFAGGSFRIDHSSGRPTVRFDPATCVGSITQVGPFEVTDARGTMSGLAGAGFYTFRALYTMARVAAHCSSTMTAFVETINGVARVKA